MDHEMKHIRCMPRLGVANYERTDLILNQKQKLQDADDTSFA
jgi:hypothetical protein